MLTLINSVAASDHTAARALGLPQRLLDGTRRLTPPRHPQRCADAVPHAAMVTWQVVCCEHRIGFGALKELPWAAPRASYSMRMCLKVLANWPVGCSGSSANAQ